MWDVKEPTHYSRRVGHEVPGAVAILCECMGGYREVMYLAWDIESRSYIPLHSYAKLDKQIQRKRNKNKKVNVHNAYQVNQLDEL